MNNVRHQTPPPLPPHRSASAREACRLIFLVFALSLPLASRAADPYAEVLEKHFAVAGEDTNGNGDGLNLTEEQANIAALQKAIIAETRKMARGPKLAPPPPDETARTGLLVMLTVLLGVVFAFRKSIGEIVGPYSPWLPAFGATERTAQKLRAEEQALSEFLLAFKTGPAALPAGSSLVAQAELENDPVKMFYARSAEILAESGRLLRKIGAATGDAARRDGLLDLHRELGVLKGAAGLPGLLPVWQMAAAVEGLVKQLTDKVSNATVSTLRTVAGGVDVLKLLCAPNVRADILTHPPIRLLAVDDDPICRVAISGALKKALQKPDLAENGEAALALAAQHAYDVIFLDVQMPGLDGFEICTKIHETSLNARTPTVFVTILNDFESHAQSILKGGSDLISKPFLTFEITVKALTFILQGRLSSPVSAAAFDQAPAHPAPQPLPGAAAASAGGALPSLPAADQNQLPVGAADPASGEMSPQAVTREFLSRASAQAGPLSELIQAAFQTKDEPARQDMLGDFYLRLNSLMPAVGSAGEHPALRLSVALEGLLKKLLQNPRHTTSSSLLTISTAVDLLRDLCASRVKPDLASNPPIRILAVDDDPVSLRAITGTLQVVFDKPAGADSGEAALALAIDKPFDVVFMDVQMPGMDGFTACLRIHETVPNGATPVVFVTSHSDFKARTQASVSGGSDFISKPFLTAEITVKALTYALRGRLQKARAAQNVMLASNEEVEGQNASAPDR